MLLYSTVKENFRLLLPKISCKNDKDTEISNKNGFNFSDNLQDN